MERKKAGPATGIKSSRLSPAGGAAVEADGGSERGAGSGLGAGSSVVFFGLFPSQGGKEED